MCTVHPTTSLRYLNEGVVMACIGLAAVDDDSDQVILVADPPQVCGVQLQARPQLGLKTLTVLLARGPQHIHIKNSTATRKRYHQQRRYQKGGTLVP
jgi:hypothetical protein